MADLGTIVGASPLNADDTTYFTSGDDPSDETTTVALGNTPSDFGTMDTGALYQLIVKLRDAPPGSGADTYQIEWCIVNAAETVVLAGASATYGSRFESPVTINDETDQTIGSPTAFTYTDTTSDKTAWDGALIELRMNKSAQSMSPDANAIQVDYFQLTGTYTLAGVDTDVDQVAPVALTLSPQLADIALDVTVDQVAPVALTVSPQLADIIYDVTVNQVAEVALTVSPQLADIIYGVNIDQLAPVALSVTTFQADIIYDKNVLQVAPVALTVTPQLANVALNVDVDQVAPVALTVTPLLADIIYDVEVKQAGVLGLNVTTFLADIIYDVEVQQVAPVALSLTPQLADIIYGVNVEQIAPVALNLTVYDATIDYTGTGLVFYYLAGKKLTSDGQLDVLEVAIGFTGSVGDSYVSGLRFSPDGELYVTFDAPLGSEVSVNGLLVTTNGVVCCVDSDGTTSIPNALEVDADGRLCTVASGAGFANRGIQVTAGGRMVIE
jgi:hypothetical protein